MCDRRWMSLQKHWSISGIQSWKYMVSRRLVGRECWRRCQESGWARIRQSTMSLGEWCSPEKNIYAKSFQCSCYNILSDGVWWLSSWWSLLSVPSWKLWVKNNKNISLLQTFLLQTTIQLRQLLAAPSTSTIRWEF